MSNFSHPYTRKKPRLGRPGLVSGGLGVELSGELSERRRVQRAHFTPLPELTLERFFDRVAEAMRLAIEPENGPRFPSWTRRVMRILKDQFIPQEFVSVLSGDASIFAEGIAVAWAAKARDLAAARGAGGGRFARRLAERLSMDAESQKVAAQVESGTLAESAEFQKQIIRRLFAPDFRERRVFAEGLAVGNRLPELFDRQARRSTTDATGIYLLLWLYWPEISKLKSLREVARALEPLFAENQNLTGSHWEERIRKLANRIGLSFRAKPRPRRTGAG